MCQQPQLLADMQQTASRSNNSATAKHTKQQYACVGYAARWMLAMAAHARKLESSLHVRCKGTVCSRLYLRLTCDNTKLGGVILAVSCPHAADISLLYVNELLKLVSSHLGMMTSTDHT